MKTMLVSLAMKTLLPILVAFIVVPVVDFIKKRLIPQVDAAPPAIKAGIALVMSTIATALTAVSGIGVPVDLSQWDGALVSALLTWVASLALKQKRQVDQRDQAIAELAKQVSPNV
jgi:hypothetical protein